jgi:hypothetical protein
MAHIVVFLGKRSSTRVLPMCSEEPKQGRPTEAGATRTSDNGPSAKCLLARALYGGSDYRAEGCSGLVTIDANVGGVRRLSCLWR